MTGLLVFEIGSTAENPAGGTSGWAFFLYLTQASRARAGRGSSDFSFFLAEEGLIGKNSNVFGK
jgi:hypothetical protein